MESAASAPRFYPSAAWTAVAVLWTIGLLNYFDRLLIVSMREALVAEIPMTDTQFGLITSSFLWVYAAFSPLGGFVADRFGRKSIILISLFSWSAAMWCTGHAHSYVELLWARGLMGISESCYLPAALALICDHHRGSTRSLATGLHNSGIYVGLALGGLGGYIAQHYGWRSGFSILGICGIAYTFVAALLLKEAEPLPVSSSVSGCVSASDTMRALVKNKTFWLFTLLFGLVSMANWLAYGWLPAYLSERFSLGAAEAGISATGYVQLASLVGVVVGGCWADRWARSNRRARMFVPAIGYAAAAPALYLVGSQHNGMGCAIAGLVFFGLGRGFFDANGMPILRQTVDERHSATGYGLLNMAGCGVGGLMTYVGGVIRDAHFSLGIAFQFAALALAAAALILALLKGRANKAFAA